MPPYLDSCHQIFYRPPHGKARFGDQAILAYGGFDIQNPSESAADEDMLMKVLDKDDIQRLPLSFHFQTISDVQKCVFT